MYEAVICEGEGGMNIAVSSIFFGFVLVGDMQETAIFSARGPPLQICVSNLTFENSSTMMGHSVQRRRKGQKLGQRGQGPVSRYVWRQSRWDSGIGAL